VLTMLEQPPVLFKLLWQPPRSSFPTRGRAPGAGARPPWPVSGLIARGPAWLSFSFGPPPWLLFEDCCNSASAVRMAARNSCQCLQSPRHPNRSGKQSPTGRCHRQPLRRHCL